MHILSRYSTVTRVIGRYLSRSLIGISIRSCAITALIDSIGSVWTSEFTGTFQRDLYIVLAGYMRKTFLGYLDDIIIFFMEG